MFQGLSQSLLLNHKFNFLESKQPVKFVNNHKWLWIKFIIYNIIYKTLEVQLISAPVQLRNSLVSKLFPSIRFQLFRIDFWNNGLKLTGEIQSRIVANL
jgi:hypothetical protein